MNLNEYLLLINTNNVKKPIFEKQKHSLDSKTKIYLTVSFICVQAAGHGERYVTCS